MKRIAGISLIVLLTAFAASAQQKWQAERHFKVYAFLPYSGYIKNGDVVKTNFQQLQGYLAGLGITKYNLIYESRITDYPDGNKTHGVINRHKLDSLARMASAEPGVIVALDLEGWNRFDTLHTPAKHIDAIAAFKQTYPQAKVGLYATVPQDTYGYPKDTVLYNRLNKAYVNVAAVVDYFSPSLYNYKTTDSLEWKKGVVYNLNACRKYGYPDKPVFPYITPEISINKEQRMLTYDEMLYRLRTLYDLGADGCLLWGSSGMRDEAGKRPVLNPDEGWFKAVLDFMKQHP